MKDDVAIWIVIQGDGTMSGRIGIRGRAGWPVCGDSDTENYCKEMAENIGVEYLGVIENVRLPLTTAIPPGD